MGFWWFFRGLHGACWLPAGTVSLEGQMHTGTCLKAWSLTKPCPCRSQCHPLQEAFPEPRHWASPT